MNTKDTNRTDVRWIKHTKNDTQKAEVKDLISNSSRVITVLQNILKEELKQKETTTPEEYKIPNWHCYQADRNGYIRAIKSFLTLLNNKED